MRRRRSSVLLISNEEDATTDYVEERLGGLADVTRLNVEQLATNFDVAFEAGHGGGVTATVARLSELDLWRVQSVYYRRPGQLSVPAGISDQSLRTFARQEWLACFRGVVSSLDEAHWVNHPTRAQTAEDKVLQLRLATRFCLTVPPTCITSSPQRARDFVERCRGDVVAKPLSSPVVRRGSELLFTYTTPLTSQDVARVEELRLAPCILQQRVPKDVEVRVNVVGRRVLAAEIHSQMSPISALDWRRYDLARTPYLPHDLNHRVAASCIAMTAHLGLDFAAIDLILTPSGRYVFLELNPNGQWGWVEELTGLPICDSLVRLLLNPRGLSNRSVPQGGDSSMSRGRHKASGRDYRSEYRSKYQSRSGAGDPRVRG